MSDYGQILLQTKLHRPRLPHDLIARARLVEMLNQGIHSQLTLVCAPAGFGKTTLVGTWLEQIAAGQGEKADPIPSAWLSLDENDSNLNLFLRYFIAALRTIFNDACEETLDLIQAVREPPQEVLFTTFSNELAELPGDAILVLDDYHAINGVDVHNLLRKMVHHWPGQLYLVLISRTNPPFPLNRYRTKGMLSEIRSRDLRFTHEETIAYLGQSQFALMIQNALPLLEEHFEGWPAGLHLAALSLRSADSQEAVLRALSSQNPDITGYLVDEVLNQQAPAIHSFLLKTSILDRFCASLCETIIGEVDTNSNVRACLDWIEHSDLFITQLDDRREWYRYHHLFQELLQQRLISENGADQVANLHRLASVWFEEHGLLDEALHHALGAGDLELAARQMSAGLRDVINREDRPTLERWLHMLPEELIQQNPGLLMLRVWALEYTWQLDLQAQVLRQIEQLMDSDGGASLPAKDLQILRGQILSLRAQQAYFSNQTAQAIDLCRQVLMLLPPSWTFVRGGAMMYLGMSLQAHGQALAAERLILTEYESYGDKADAYSLFLLLSLCFIYLNPGQLEQSRQIAQLMVQRSIRARIAIMKDWGDWFLGVVCYQRNELEAAAQYFTQIIENRFTAQITVFRDGMAGLAMVHQIKGESTEAMRMVEAISQYDLEQRGSEDLRTQSLRARLMLLQGDLEGASAWADTFTGLPPDMALLWLEEPQVTRAQILLARGKEADIQSALQIIDTLEEITNRTHNTYFKLKVQVLRAMALDSQGQTSHANAELKQALDLARVGGFIRVFVDLGKPIQNMLGQLAKQGYAVTRLNRILAAFPQDDKSLGSSAHHPSPGISALTEHLTPREMEVLSLLRGPSSIKEIALKLHISYGTAKGYTINLYAKLGVNRRWDAVARAEELNILPPH